MDNDFMSPALKFNKSTINIALNILGSGLAIIGVIFVVARLHNYWQKADSQSLPPISWLLIGFMAICYGIINLLLAIAWKSILLHLTISVEKRWAIRTYGISQLAKYIPGNIFHIAGRQAIAMASGYPSRQVLKSNFYELILIAIAGSTSIFLIIPIIFPVIPQVIGVMITVLSIIITFAVIKVFFSKQLSYAFLLQLLFLSLSAIIFTFILTEISFKERIPLNYYIYIFGAYTIAWLVGLITPGAPAGVGIRELVIVFCLRSIIPESELLLAVVLGRFVTVLGDVVFYFYVYTLLNIKKDKSHEPVK
ncbi:hypothetical protein [Rahnella aceris]|uniref:Integral membrane protein n=1 Tax=Rahnella sp. (strain Y9602) TaxID=2703885 RepID=A0ABW6CEY8_RAHSY